MNKYSLNLKQNGLEREYHSQQIEICKRQAKPLLLIYFAIALSNLVFLQIHQNQSTSSIKQLLSQEQFYVLLSFLVLWLACVIISLILLQYMPQKFNIFYNFQQFINITYNIISFELNVSSIIYQSNQEIIKCETDQSQIKLPILEGFLLSILIIKGFLGTQFLIKAFLLIFTLTSLTCISISETQIPCIQILIGFACQGVFLTQLYEEDRNKRKDFLLRKKDEQWDKIVKNVLPTNVIIAKFNQKESRIELEQVNKKANKKLGITSNESFQQFAKSTIVQPNDLNSDEQDFNNILKFSSKTNKNQSFSRNVNLYELIRDKINEQTKCQGRSSLKLQQNNFDSTIDQINESSSSENKQKKKILQSPQIQEKNSFTNLCKVSEFIGSYCPNQFDVEKKLLIRVSTFSLNDIFAVLTIENETYREKYIKQIKFSTFLEKIFSFQLEKFKESYLIVLDELNRINNQKILNKLKYQNIKCINRINSYLQYFELKNSSKFDFVVTKFSLKLEIKKILLSLKNYVIEKRIRTYYENISSLDIIQSDQQRVQQIFFMIVEHLIFNSPQDGYVGIRVVQDETISNCFKFQIQSTYNSNLLNSIDLLSFNIDELYNDYNTHNNYFVPLRMAIKQITLIGPYNKITLNKKQNKESIFISFNLFSDLEIIKNNQNKVQQNNNFSSQMRQLNQPKKLKNIIQLYSSRFKELSQSRQNIQQSTLRSQSDSNSIFRPIKFQNSPKSNQIQNLKTNECNSLINSFFKNKKSTSSNQIENESDSHNTGNLTGQESEQDSFNQWLQLKQFQYSCIDYQNFLDVQMKNSQLINQQEQNLTENSIIFQLNKNYKLSKQYDK